MSETILALFFKYFDIQDKEIRELYYNAFNSLGNPDTKIQEIIATWKPEYGRKYPSIAEILEEKNIVSKEQEQIEVEAKWQEFTKARPGNPWHKLPDWVYTIKKQIGIRRVEDATTEEWNVWIRKEFLEVYKQLKHGTLQLQSDPRFITIGGQDYMQIEKGNTNGLTHI